MCIMGLFWWVMLDSYEINDKVFGVYLIWLWMDEY